MSENKDVPIKEQEDGSILAKIELPEEIEGDEEKKDKNKQWIKVRKNDVYIEQTIKSLDKIIAQSADIVKEK